MRTPTCPRRRAARPGDGAPLASLPGTDLGIEIRAADILRSLGYPQDGGAPTGVARLVRRSIAEARMLLRPRGTYSLHAIEAMTARTLTIGGITLRGRFGEFLKGARRAAVFVVTAGGEISRRAKARCEAGESLEGLVLDAIGSWAAESAAQALAVRLGEQLGPGESFTLRYSPGYCGLHLRQQLNLFRLADAGSAGVALTPALLMQPIKSISGIIGLGPRDEVGEHLSPCELCPLADCRMRR